MKTQLENRNKEFVQLNVIKNNFVIIEAENKTLRETIRKLEEQNVNGANCDRALKEERNSIVRIKADFDKQNKDFELLSGEALNLRKQLDQCANDNKAIQNEFGTFRQTNGASQQAFNQMQAQN